MNEDKILRKVSKAKYLVIELMANKDVGKAQVLLEVLEDIRRLVKGQA